jgi:predicted  nucleic acid-binding Zn-ribbon protein
MFYPYFSTNTHFSEPKCELLQKQVKIANFTCTSTNLGKDYNSLITKFALVETEIISLKVKIESINKKIDNLTVHQINRDSLQSAQNALQAETYKLQAKIKTLEIEYSILKAQLQNLTKLINQCPLPNRNLRRPLPNRDLRPPLPNLELQLPNPFNLNNSLPPSSFLP